MLDVSGAVDLQFYLKSEQYVPERMLNKINKATSLITENGLSQFYLSTGVFKEKLAVRNIQNGERAAFQALKLEQLKLPLILISCLLGVALGLLFVEIIIYKRRNQTKMRIIYVDEDQAQNISTESGL